MENPSFDAETVGSADCEDQTSDNDTPQFGAIDIVEAFTAMRHEWRGQTKESRALAEQIAAVAANIQDVEAKLQAKLVETRGGGNPADDKTEARSLVLLIVDTDHQLSRAVAAITQWDGLRRLSTAADQKAAEQYFAGMNWLARWFSRSLLSFVAAQRDVQLASAESPAVEGLSLVLGRLRRVMHEHAIVRVDTLGREFDPNTMHAIGTVSAADCPAGHVAEQISPAYFWRDRLLRFAEVRVAE